MDRRPGGAERVPWPSAPAACTGQGSWWLKVQFGVPACANTLNTHMPSAVLSPRENVFHLKWEAPVHALFYLYGRGLWPQLDAEILCEFQRTL